MPGTACSYTLPGDKISLRRYERAALSIRIDDSAIFSTRDRTLPSSAADYDLIFINDPHTAQQQLSARALIEDATHDTLISTLIPSHVTVIILRALDEEDGVSRDFYVV